ncbi:hypothetical protein F4813DRAFT_395223 [Daldinia decipiens]|uniref:uncharacterized protein n=1 Tax=Daldinia decipiens TaxID=326647 RepID=UPI0020C30DA3|nr:uncharacterized protein F4813DRAFT_395223 [Daldinia decipiens]KAI1659354.1 hypothetical protein F4813DRAFT_395223 [Daldinia decipiens]
MSSPVPIPRQFLTSLIESLNSIPTPPTPQPSLEGANPLKLIPPAHRPLLTTLYALYPLTLLPALDLLDRHLATRIIIAPSRPQGDTTAPAAPHEEQQPPTPHHPFYIVRSAQPQHPRRDTASASASAPGPRYVVRLSAWNCSCAAFAFAAFPRGEDRYVAPSPADRTREDALEWQFGALSLDGTDGSGIAGVPCCKHLLACVLAERWSAVLGGYVDERVVGREEAAGLVADV